MREGKLIYCETTGMLEGESPKEYATRLKKLAEKLKKEREESENSEDSKNKEK